MKSEETRKLIEKVFRFNKLVHRQLGSLVECAHGEFKMLGVIYSECKSKEEKESMEPGVTVSKLSECLMHSKPATSKMLNVLEEKQFIERVTTKQDRRNVYIRLTPDGEKRIKTIQNRMDEFANQMLQRLGEEDTTLLLQLMDRMYDIVLAYGEDIVKEIEENEKNNSNVDNK